MLQLAESKSRMTSMFFSPGLIRHLTEGCTLTLIGEHSKAALGDLSFASVNAINNSIKG
jgi:hypothetical protein